ncbi:helix-turn-helix transcriptional regulator [Veronia pacifica]|uniref:HTH luxR-type domain-containing protein n=1 Tax=Veronia pacifica TaxID=1080227 RepID=A0A1C3E8Z0_9GAMM|nr:LuxR family transcriptional regulator [Veronia pacifica]ODA29694.1 hypothetical protein A8L45_21960 [Veronia pacifica]
MKDVIDTIQTIRESESKQALTDAVNKSFSIVGFEHFLLGYVSHESMMSSDTTILDNYPKPWRHLYDSESLINKDPIVHYCMHQSSPLIWHNLKQKHLDKDQKALMHEAKNHGLAHGFSVPLHGSRADFGILSFASSQHDHPDIELAIQKAQILAPAILDKLTALKKKVDVKLTKRETECLLWVSEGKSSWEISMIIGCSERTVVFHLTNATNKLGCTNRYQAVSKAIILGLISPLM